MNSEKNLESLKIEIKQLIIESLNLTNVKVSDIDDNAFLFEPSNVLELDSVDALELVMALQRKYNVRLDDQNTSRNVLQSINTIAEFVYKETSGLSK
ncbi:MAG: hypothetical protein ACD_79C00709G0004 [uncultured bacterium]|nr:MAG: hypothetical protein ACD_79C00709G0004 [uncultured bacterium]